MVIARMDGDDECDGPSPEILVSGPAGQERARQQEMRPSGGRKEYHSLIPSLVCVSLTICSRTSSRLAAHYPCNRK